jgi:hypothetical protein
VIVAPNGAGKTVTVGHLAAEWLTTPDPPQVIFCDPAKRDFGPHSRQKAAVAVAHSLLVVIYHVLRDRRPYHELGAGYFDTLNAAQIERHHVRRLEQLGYAVALTPKRATA